MNFLLDTHTFLWLDSNQGLLSSSARQIVSNIENSLWVSVASVWEMQIKIGLGKMRLTPSLPETISQQQETNGVQILPVDLPHVFELKNLPAHHKDPFDRLLIAQAKNEGWTIVSADPEFKLYPVRVIW